MSRISFTRTLSGGFAKATPSGSADLSKIPLLTNSSMRFPKLDTPKRAASSVCSQGGSSEKWLALSTFVEIARRQGTRKPDSHRPRGAPREGQGRTIVVQTRAGSDERAGHD